VARRPLETPRPLPAPMLAMARAVTRWADPPRFTTGPATRHALAAAGALGATTGSVVHLPSVPTGDPASTAVLAHELAHARHPVRRPRFRLAVPGVMTHEEHQADTVAEQVVGPGVVGRLRVGGGGAAAKEVATQVARAEVLNAALGPGGFGPTGAQRVMGFDGNGNGTGDTTTPPSEVGSPAVPDPGGWAAAVEREGSGVLDLDRVVAAVEHRLLLEIERRGGRWAGVF
jgi:Domain of unknown function (DUF4157)